MPNLYSIQFEIEPASGQSAGELLAEILEHVIAWVGEKYTRSWKTGVSFPAANNTVEPLSGHSLHHSSQIVGAAALIRIRWIHPDDKDASMQWSTDIAIGRLDDRVQFALQTGATSLAFVVRPAWLTPGRPRIVTEILTRYSCKMGQFHVPTRERMVAALDVPAFVDSVLLNRERTLPVLVISQDVLSDHASVDADRLNRTLIGLAQVVEIDKWGAFQLTKSVGKALSCFNGCVRIYWPGFSRASDPMQHALYFPSLIEKFRVSGKTLDQRLFGFLAKVTVYRFTEGELIREVRARIDAEHLAESERTRKRIQKGATDAQTLQDLQPLYEMALVENAELLEEVKQLKSEKADLARDLSTAKSNWDAFQQHQALSSEDEAVVEQEPGQAEIDSVLSALELAETEFDDDLFVLDTARESAAASEFARTDEVYQALMAIRDVGKLYFDSVRKGSSMGTWAEQLSKRGFNQYSQTESDTVKNDYKKFGRYREFVVNGAKRRIYQHLDLGGGDRKNCLQIYFEANRELNRVVLAHCGEHLPYPRQRT